MGGLSGHMMHPHDNVNLTIKEFTGLIRNSLGGKIKMSEKLDGFNIHFMKYNGELRLARNAKDLLTGGFGYDDIAKRFENARVCTTFQIGYEMISKQFNLDNLSEFTLTGETYNAEIIVAGRTNIMYYGQNMLVVHNIHRWVNDGNKYKVVEIRPVKAGFTARLNYTPMLDVETTGITDTLFREAFEPLGLTKDNTLLDYYKAIYVIILDKLGYDLTQDPETYAILFNRFFGLDKTNLRDIRKNAKVDIQPLLDKERLIMKAMKADLDNWVLAIGTKMLQRARGLNSAAGTEYKACAVLEEEINEAAKTDEFTRRWGYTGNTIFGMEGIVVEYKGNLYKWTGPFAPINQLLGGKNK